MAGICTNSTRDSGGDCEHLTLTVSLDGESITVKSGIHDPQWAAALTADEKQTLLKLLCRWWKGKGANLANFIGRVLAGEEGSNVKQYDFLGPGNTVTKTNIGTSYVNLLPGLNGERILVDFSGCTEFRVVLTANLVGTGPFGARIIRDGDSTVLYENASINVTGERELDTGWVAIPQGFSGPEVLRAQVKSTVGADDPIFRRMGLLTR
jgi:hypothetical protein